jgi:preprotein translocase subunit SecG
MLKILLMIVSAILIILTLLQSGKSEGLSGAFTGSGSLNLFQNVKERGPEKTLTILTGVFGALFFLIVILIRVL